MAVLSYGYGFFWDPTYILVLIGAMICLLASNRMKATFRKYKKVRSMSGLTGAQVARKILDQNNILNVSVCRVSGDLTDHYDPVSGTVNLSDSVYDSTSVAAVGVAAHECGHVMQHEHSYMPMIIRGKIVPAVNIGSAISWPLIIVGLLMSAWMNNSTLGSIILQLGIICFSAVVVFQVVTLPVEFNASRRGLQHLENFGILGNEEMPGAKKVLHAAALTYVAAVASSILQLLRIILISRNND